MHFAFNMLQIHIRILPSFHALLTVQNNTILHGLFDIGKMTVFQRIHKKVVPIPADSSLNGLHPLVRPYLP